MAKRILMALLVTMLAVSTGLATPDRLRGPRQGHDLLSPGGEFGRGHFGGSDHGRLGMGRLVAMADELGLSTEQVDQLENIRLNFALESVDRKAELKKARIRLNSLKRADAPERKVLAAIDEVSDLQGEMNKLRYRHRQQMKEVLDEKQQEKLKELRKERHSAGKRNRRR